jgi:hypothetical protein
MALYRSSRHFSRTASVVEAAGNDVVFDDSLLFPLLAAALVLDEDFPSDDEEDLLLLSVFPFFELESCSLSESALRFSPDFEFELAVDVGDDFPSFSTNS